MEKELKEINELIQKLREKCRSITDKDESKAFLLIVADMKDMSRDKLSGHIQSTGVGKVSALAAGLTTFLMSEKGALVWQTVQYLLEEHDIQIGKHKDIDLN